MASGELVIATLLVTSVLAGVIGAVAPRAEAASPASQSDCGQTVVHDAFQSDKAVSQWNETGELRSSIKHTNTRLEENAGFVRLHAENPNGYCVTYEVLIREEVVSPAELGQIKSNDENVTAGWHAVQNLSSGKMFTRVEFTLDPGTEATFAPSKGRVFALSWTGTAEEASGGFLSSLSSLGSSTPLEKRSYTIDPTSTSRVSVDLTKNGSQVESWQATYEAGDGRFPVSKDSEDPVYYQQPSSERVVFIFNDPDASVKFVADPSPADRIGYQTNAYSAGIRRWASWIPFQLGVSSAGAAGLLVGRRWSA